MNRKSFFRALGLGAVGAAAFKLTGKPEAQALTSMQRAFDACEAGPCETCGGFGVVVTEHNTGGSIGGYSDGRFLSSPGAVTWVSGPCPDCGGPKIHWTSTQERVRWENSNWGELE